MSWVDPRVGLGWIRLGWVEILQFSMGWVGLNMIKVLYFWMITQHYSCCMQVELFGSSGKVYILII